jgi:hypothetical protein
MVQRKFHPFLDSSLSTLTTTDYGIIVPEYLAGILTNLETVADQFCLAMTAARLLTLKPQARPSPRPVDRRSYLQHGRTNGRG